MVPPPLQPACPAAGPPAASEAPGAGRVLVLSDLHLGRPGLALAATDLEPLLEGVDGVLVNGDVAEIQMHDARAAAARAVAELQALCDRHQVQLHLIAGNHDAFVAEERHALLAGGAVHVTHGDVLHPAVAPWARGARSCWAWGACSPWPWPGAWL